MEIFYKTGKFVTKLIEPVEVDRITDKFIWVSGSQVSKSSEFAQYHETWEDAHAFLMVKARQKLDGARRQLELAQGHYDNVKGMKRPL